MWEVVFHPILAAPHRIVLFYNGVPKFGTLEVPVKGPGTEPWAGGIGKINFPHILIYQFIFMIVFNYILSCTILFYFYLRYSIMYCFHLKKQSFCSLFG